MKYITILLLLCFSSLLANEMQTYNIKDARKLYMKATKDEELLDSAITYFKELGKADSCMKPVSITYIGSLTMCRAVFTGWPHKKIDWVNTALPIIDEGVACDTNNIESIFIYGSSCYFLPFLWDRSDGAKERLMTVVDLIGKGEADKHGYEWVYQAIKFISVKIELEEEERKIVDALVDKYTKLVSLEIIKQTDEFLAP